jgi:hypothetical protein
MLLIKFSEEYLYFAGGEGERERERERLKKIQ